ncbi:TlpA family protein disulfide reductase [Geomicrobium sediminis]|uniref:Peroxiredoxin n=1 Tax=Geomicrobium sediminis TaxID=1347788 RepID=A0ABS2PF06_9BACL|nr:TlpA disulfide reductase family protein [Geomicrobium sediminis]MBM7634012.1 peroxiredoxin [Geomicrobium sediminis]
MVLKISSIGALLIATLVMGGIIYNSVSSPPMGVNQGEEAPDIELPQAGGESMSLNDVRGTFVIMNFWASWCEPCIREFPMLNQVHQKFGDERVNVLAVNMSSFERTMDEAMEFLDDRPVTMPVLFDMDGEMADEYQVAGLPTTYLINEEGIIVDIIMGEVTEEMLIERIQPFL